MQSKLDKFLKYLWLVNGILIPGLLTYYIFKDNMYATYYEAVQEENIIVGEELEEAKRKGLALQGVNYVPPSEIYNSKNHLVEVSAHTYEEAKLLEELKSSAGDISPPSYFNLINIIFLDENYKVIRRLLDRKAFISRYLIKEDSYSPYADMIPKEIDTTVKNIIYEIGFDDTNKDGILNAEDFDDLYVSDLDGSNFKRVIVGVDIREFAFRKRNSEILITYKDRSSEREEYKKEKYAIYTIATGKLRLLEEIEKELAEIEKMLIN